MGDITREEIDNEANVVSQLCRPGVCRNVVEVTQHGWLPRKRSLYYIDMEYCTETLEKRIGGEPEAVPPERTAIPIPHRVEVKSERTAVTNVVDNKSKAKREVMTEATPEVEFNLEPILTIVEDIASALVYIHSQKVVHRDLKPRNGILHYILYRIYISDIEHSVVFTKG